MRETLLALELRRRCVSHILCRVELGQGGRHRERKLDRLGPLRVVRTEVQVGTVELPAAAPELVRKHGDSRPVARMPNQARLDGIGHHVGELLNHCLLGQQSNDRGLLVIPGRTLPLAKHLSA